MNNTHNKYTGPYNNIPCEEGQESLLSLHPFTCLRWFLSSLQRSVNTIDGGIKRMEQTMTYCNLQAIDTEPDPKDMLPFCTVLHSVSTFTLSI